MSWNGSGQYTNKRKPVSPTVYGRTPLLQRNKWIRLALLGVASVIAISFTIWICTDQPQSEEHASVAKTRKPSRIAQDKCTVAKVSDLRKQTVQPKKKHLPTLPPKPAFMDAKPRTEWTSEEQAKAYQWYALDPNNRVEGVDMTQRVAPPVFSNIVQECLAPYLIPGADVVPMGPITDAQAREAINTPIDFNFDDSDELLNKKQGVKEMLAELKDYMDKGGHASDYFLQLESRQVLESDGMQIVREKVREMERQGDYAGAVEALDVFNKYLEGKGLPKVHMRIRNKGYTNE